MRQLSRVPKTLVEPGNGIAGAQMQMHACERRAGAASNVKIAPVTPCAIIRIASTSHRTTSALERASN